MRKTFSIDNKAIFYLVFGVLILKLLLLPYSQTTDADAVSRVFLSLNWLDNPHWIKTSVWAPFHFYLIGFSLWLWNDIVFTPKIVNILFSVLTLIPFYFFVKREFNKNGAFIATVFLALSPILFRNSFLALSETPYLFFLVMAINYLSKGIRENSNLQIAYAGLAITIAAGFRYEAWLIMILFGALLLVYRKWKLVPIYSITSLLFPIAWIVSNWMETGNPLHGIQGNYKWTLEMMGNNDNVDLEEYARRIWFFPFSWVIAVGIPTGYVIIKILFKGYTATSRSFKIIIYSLPFWIMFAFFMYNSFKGVLLLQHRFSGTLVVLSLPFIAIFFKDLTPKKIKLTIGFGMFPVIMSFLWNTNGVQYIPRLHNQSAVTISALTNNNLGKESCLIIDNLGWEDTYFIALHSKLKHQNILINGGAKNSIIPLQRINALMDVHRKGILILQKNSALYSIVTASNYRVSNKLVHYSEIYNEKDILLLHFHTKP